MPITLIGGGSRSGKSSYALTYARNLGTRRAFIATAQAIDEEMNARIAAHQRDRGADFITYEEPLALARRIESLDKAFDVIVADCLTLWLSNLLLGAPENLCLQSEYANLIAASGKAQSAVVFVTNEVGCGIVPDNALSRRFRDEAGRLNQTVAAAATEVYWMAFGIPLRMKSTLA